jgi:signal transduction histidine kinase
LARELHDSVTQSLFSVSLAAEGLKGAIGENLDPTLQRALTLLLDQLVQMRSEMRGLILELRPVELGSQSLEEAILGHANSLERSTNIQINTRIKGAIEDLPRDIQTGLNRIVQESLSNIARHARADHVSITLDFSDATATLTVKDDGCGFDVEIASQRIGAYGLMNIHERSELFGGTVDIKSEKENGTTITVIIPIKENSV